MVQFDLEKPRFFNVGMAQSAVLLFKLVFMAIFAAFHMRVVHFPAAGVFRSAGVTIQTGGADVLEMKFMGEFNGVKGAIGAVGAAKRRKERNKK
jgi:hypothetical protein